MFSNIRCAVLLLIIACSYHDLIAASVEQEIIFQLPQEFPASKKLLVDEIISITRKHLPQEEMFRLNTLLQDLISDISLETAIRKKEILRKKLKAAIGIYVIKSKMCIKSAVNNSLIEKTQEELINLIAKILATIDLSEWKQIIDENFVKQHANNLSALIVKILSEELPVDCLQAITQALTVLTKIENTTLLRLELTNFFNKHSSVLPTL